MCTRRLPEIYTAADILPYHFDESASTGFWKEGEVDLSAVSVQL